MDEFYQTPRRHKLSKTLVFGLLIFLIGCVEKKLTPSGEGGQDVNYCSWHYILVTGIDSDVNADFDVTDKEVGLATNSAGDPLYQNDCNAEPPLSNKMSISRTAGALRVEYNDIIRNYELDGNEIPIASSKITSENGLCEITYTRIGELDPAFNRFIFEELYEFRGQCF